VEGGDSARSETAVALQVGETPECHAIAETRTLKRGGGGSWKGTGADNVLSETIPARKGRTQEGKEDSGKKKKVSGGANFLKKDGSKGETREEERKLIDQASADPGSTKKGDFPKGEENPSRGERV